MAAGINHTATRDSLAKASDFPNWLQRYSIIINNPNIQKEKMNNDAISNPMCLLESSKPSSYDRFTGLGSRRQRAVFAPERDAPERQMLHYNGMPK